MTRKDAVREMTATSTPPAHGTARHPGQHPGRHPVNVGHLVMGLAFLGIAAIWGLVQTGLVSGRDVRWLLPLPWVLAGSAGLLSMGLARRRSQAVPPAAGQAPAADAASRTAERDAGAAAGLDPAEENR